MSCSSLSPIPQLPWEKAPNSWASSISGYENTLMKEPAVTSNGSVKMTSNGGQKLLLQALVYEVVTAGVPGRRGASPLKPGCGGGEDTDSHLV